jgi:hypothetical protein
MFHENHEKTAKNLAKSQSKESRPHREAYERILKKIEGSIQEEKSFNREWQESLKRLDEDEKKKQDIREAMNKHYFKQLKDQIAERKTNRYSQSQPRGTETEFMKEEGYVWKGMNREEWRNVLNWQIEEKKKIKQDLKIKEIEKDRTRIENAQKSLDDEMKVREIKKKKAQNDMWESWEKTREVARMQKELEKIRRYGDSVQPRNQYTPGKRNGDYFENILKGYEKTFGKIEGGMAGNTGNTGKYIVSSRRLFRKNSKNSLMNASSYTNASIKLGDLIKEENELKTQKFELMKILNKSKEKNRRINEFES